MTDAERDYLLQALALAVKDLQARHDKMADAIHNVNQRLSLQEAASVIEQIAEGEVESCVKH
jgi:hypothetical protein